MEEPSGITDRTEKTGARSIPTARHLNSLPSILSIQFQNLVKHMIFMILLRTNIRPDTGIWEPKQNLSLSTGPNLTTQLMLSLVNRMDSLASHLWLARMSLKAHRDGAVSNSNSTADLSTPSTVNDLTWRSKSTIQCNQKRRRILLLKLKSNRKKRNKTMPKKEHSADV